MSTVPPLVEARTAALQFRLPRSPLGPVAVAPSAAAALVDGPDVRLGEPGPVALQVERVDVAVLAVYGPRDAAPGSESRGTVGPAHVLR